MFWAPRVRGYRGDRPSERGRPRNVSCISTPRFSISEANPTATASAVRGTTYSRVRPLPPPFFGPPRAIPLNIMPTWYDYALSSDDEDANPASPPL